MLGDPLLALGLPQSGFNVFGPAARLEAVDPAQPALRLPETAGAVALAGALAPGGDGPSTYWVRRLDAQGRADGGASAARVQVVDGVGVAPAVLPAWPDTDGWPARAVGDEVHAVAVWPGAWALHGVARVELEAETDKGVLGVWSGEPTAGVRHVAARFAFPVGAARLRWRVHHVDGAQAAGPWSAALEASAVSATTIPLYEVQP